MLSEPRYEKSGYIFMIENVKILKSLKVVFSNFFMNNQLLKSLLLFCAIILSYDAVCQVDAPLFTDRHELTLIEDTFILGYTETNYTFYILTKDEYWELKMVSERDLVKSYYVRNDLIIDKADIKDLTWVTTDSAAYLVAEGSGNIYEFTGNSIIRLDNTYDQRANASSTYFVHNNNIFNFSGYGYFQYPSFISKYDLKTRKLSAFLPNDGTLVPPSRVRLLSLFNEERGLLYVWGGARVSYTNSVSSVINNTNELWCLDMESRNWTRLGMVNMPIAFSNNQNNDSFITFSSNQELFSILGSRLYVFDIFNNHISTYKISEGFDLSVDANIQPAYSNSSKVLLLSTIPFPNQNIRRVQFVSLSNYRSELVSETKLLKTHIKTIVTYAILIAFILGLAYLLYYLYKNYYVYYNKLIIIRSTKTIKFNNKLIKVLDTEETELVFWIAQSDDFVTTNYIMDRPSDGSQSYESMKKRKLSTMKSIEVKLGAFSQVKKDVFTEKKSTEDLRLKEYKLNNEWIIVKD
ncbi:MAG: hypothetical protein KKG99_11090 [Bacteroidetes bacterium]|nr:hypothetical protein [Bacteroidota bacterium]